MKDKFASSAVINNKGQIVIPKEIRNMFNLKSGDSVLILADKERGIAIVDYDKYKSLYDVSLNGENK